MKYNESSKFPKSVGGLGFYAIIICCLIAIGGASWFAVSKFGSSKSDDASSKQKSYESPSPSYTDSADVNSTPSTDVGKAVSDVPYTDSSTSSTVTPTENFVIPVEGNISKNYSDTALQYSATYGDMRMHTGIDIECKKGTKIKSAGNGTVLKAEETADYGKVITIDHGNGITVRYCGFDTMNVAEGAKVNAGDVIGISGIVPSECQDKEHIHLEIFKDNSSVSPFKMLGLE